MRGCIRSNQQWHGYIQSDFFFSFFLFSVTKNSLELCFCAESDGITLITRKTLDLEDGLIH